MHWIWSRLVWEFARAEAVDRPGPPTPSTPSIGIGGGTRLLRIRTVFTAICCSTSSNRVSFSTIKYDFVTYGVGTKIEERDVCKASDQGPGHRGENGGLFHTNVVGL